VRRRCSRPVSPKRRELGKRNYAKANGSAIGNSSPVQIDMIDNGGRLKDQTSSLSGGGSFSDTWLRAN
jgi:hypothetical protein